MIQHSQLDRWCRYLQEIQSFSYNKKGGNYNFLNLGFTPLHFKTNFVLLSLSLSCRIDYENWKTKLTLNWKIFFFKWCSKKMLHSFISYQKFLACSHGWAKPWSSNVFIGYVRLILKMNGFPALHFFLKSGLFWKVDFSKQKNAHADTSAAHPICNSRFYFSKCFVQWASYGRGVRKRIIADDF